MRFSGVTGRARGPLSGIMNSIVGALIEPLARRWSGQVAGASLAFWAAGLLAYVISAPLPRSGAWRPLYGGAVVPCAASRGAG